MRIYFRLKYRLLFPIVSRLLLFFNRQSRLEPVNPPPFFILGSGRNGSTLLASLLNNHPKLFVPPEQYVLPYLYIKWLCHPFKSAKALARDFIEELSKKEKTYNWKLNKHETKLAAENELSDSDSFQKVIYKLYEAEAKSKNITFELWGDKTPILIHYFNLLQNQFSTSKFIFLVRDPRDVVLSYQKMKKHPASNHRFAVWKWNDSIRMLNNLRNNIPDNQILICRYEDLVKSPDQELERIQVFLGVNKTDLTNSMSDAGKLMGVEKNPYHQNLKKSISPDRVGLWRDKLPPAISDYVSEKTRSQLRYFGYEL